MKRAFLVLTLMLFSTASLAAVSPINFFRNNILNNVWLGIDGPDGGNSRMACYNEEDYDAPINADGSRPKAIICWRSDDWHGLAGINRGWPVRLRVDPDKYSIRYEFSNTNPKKLLVWEAEWAITCLNCVPAIPTITLDVRYEYNIITGRLDEILLQNRDTGAPVARRPIKFKSVTS